MADEVITKSAKKIFFYLQPRQALTVGKLSSNTTSAASKSTSALDNGQTKTNGNSNAKKDTSDHENDVDN